MRSKRQAKVCEYLLIGGYSLGQAGHVAPTISLTRGNGYGEETIEILERFPIGTTYKAVKERCDELSKSLDVTVGRNFTDDEWLGPEV